MAEGTGLAQSPVDGVGRSALIRHDAGDFGDSIFSAGHTNWAYQKTGWRRPVEQAREQKRFILEVLQAGRPSTLRKDVLGRHFQMSKAQVLFQLWQLMKRNCRKRDNSSKILDVNFVN